MSVFEFWAIVTFKFMTLAFFLRLLGWCWSLRWPIKWMKQYMKP